MLYTEDYTLEWYFENVARSPQYHRGDAWGAIRCGDIVSLVSSLRGKWEVIAQRRGTDKILYTVKNLTTGEVTEVSEHLLTGVRHVPRCVKPTRFESGQKVIIHPHRLYPGLWTIQKESLQSNPIVPSYDVIENATGRIQRFGWYNLEGIEDHGG